MDGETTLLLAPVLVVAVVVLLGFVGCYNGLDEGDQTDTTDFPEKLPYVKHVLDDGPVAYWRLVDTLLDTEPAQANDEIVVPPGPHHGSLNSLGTNLTLAAWPSFLLGDNSKSMYFDGGYVAVEVAGQPELSPGAFSLECFVLPDWTHAPGDPAPPRVVVASNDQTTSTGWRLYATDNHEWQGQVWDGTQGYPTPVTPIVFDDKPVHLVLTYGNGTLTLGTLTLYVNGQAFPLGGISGIPFMANTTAPIYIGVRAPGTPPEEPFKGPIQEVAFYNVALTSTQIQDHYTSKDAVNL